MAVILETQRLLLRHLTLGDLDELYALYSDPDIRKHFPEGILNLDETREELKWHMHGHPDNNKLGLWATTHKETGKCIGIQANAIINSLHHGMFT